MHCKWRLDKTDLEDEPVLSPGPNEKQFIFNKTRHVPIPVVIKK